MRNFSRVSLLAERIYRELIAREPLLNENGEAPGAVDHFRRLVGEQRALAFDLGLSPRSKQLLPVEMAGTLDLAEMRKEAEANGNGNKRAGRPCRVHRIDVQPEDVVDAEGDPEVDREQS